MSREADRHRMPASPLRLMVRTSGFQPENRGSIPLGGTNCKRACEALSCSESPSLGLAPPLRSHHVNPSVFAFRTGDRNVETLSAVPRHHLPECTGACTGKREP